MAVKTVFLPIMRQGARLKPAPGQTLPEQARAAETMQVEYAEDDLDSLLNEGYQVVSSHPLEVDNRIGIVLICHKISVPKAEDDAADGS